MNYADAFKIGSKCDGYIKCTYAQLANYDLGVLFSLQRGYFYKNKARQEFNELADAAETAYQNSGATEYAQLNTDAWGYLTVDVPIVKAAEHIEIQKPNNFVPVTLTNEAIQVIVNILSRSKKVAKYLVYRIWIANTGDAYGSYWSGKNHYAGERELVMETYKTDDLKEWNEYKKRKVSSGGRGGGGTNYVLTEKSKEAGYYVEIEEKRVDNPKTQEMISAIKEGRTFFVKACAIDWVATDINNATIVQKDADGNEVQVNLNNQLEAARKRLETAKALLATAATLTIL